jgi:hypothetical protein
LYFIEIDQHLLLRQGQKNSGDKRKVGPEEEARNEIDTLQHILFKYTFNKEMLRKIKTIL